MGFVAILFVPKNKVVLTQKPSIFVYKVDNVGDR